VFGKGRIDMDLSSITGVRGVSGLDSAERISSLTGALKKDGKVEGTLFDSFLNAAIDNIKTTNDYLSKAEDEKIKFALGQTENTHDLTIAMQKASAALQYTVSIRDKLMEAYKEIMQMQI
jgi:flagellar hook-basal body complex protein FliE